MQQGAGEQIPPMASSSAGPSVRRSGDSACFWRALLTATALGESANASTSLSERGWQEGR